MKTATNEKMLTPELKPKACESPFMKLIDNSDDAHELATARASTSSVSREDKPMTELDIQKDRFKRKMLGKARASSDEESFASKASWTSTEYDIFVKTVRRHGKNQAKILEALEGKSRC